jgi:hypothetical protein
MDADMLVFAKIVAVCVLIVGIVSYIFSRQRGNRYLVYADNFIVKTKDGHEYKWADVKYIRYINKYVIGKGTTTANYALLFCFKKGKVLIDRRSNIYHQVFRFAEQLQVTKKTVTTKGLLKEEQV